MSQIIEIVRFKLNNGADPIEFAKSAEDITIWAKKQKGFQSRTLSVNEDGEWVDVNFWDSRADNEAANSQFMEANANTPFMKMIDPSTLNMNLSDVKFVANV